MNTDETQPVVGSVENGWIVEIELGGTIYRGGMREARGRREVAFRGPTTSPNPPFKTPALRLPLDLTIDGVAERAIDHASCVADGMVVLILEANQNEGSSR